MISKLSIKSFKCIDDQTFNLRPVTILTGCNSTGKSSVIQAILAFIKYSDQNSSLLNNLDFSFANTRNKFLNAKQISIGLELSNGKPTSLTMVNGIAQTQYNAVSVDGKELPPLRHEDNVYYLCANRNGFSDIEKISDSFKIGTAGEYVMGTYESEKDRALIPELIVAQESQTLSWQVNYWLSYILDQNLGMRTESVDTNSVKTIYTSEKVIDVAPRHLGVGVSYLTKFIITCLRASSGDLIMVENPEIHLHPGAQSRLAEFIAFVAQAGIQLIVETHCEHLINKFQHVVYSSFRGFKADDLAVYYKPSIREPFEEIRINKRGKFEPEFPEGFFDATLSELIEIN